MCNCEKINTCGSITYASCVSYEGVLPEISKYYNQCDVTVENTVEELYEFIQSSEKSYFAGTGLNLNASTFSVRFGTLPNTVMEGSWRPDWTEVQNKPVIPEQVNLIEGQNTTITGTYPNLTINASNGSGEVNVINSITLGSTVAPVISKNVIIPTASVNRLGLVKAGTNITIQPDGTISSLSGLNYTGGTGIDIVDTVISNSAPNATHTGDVTGSSTLTIALNVVNNSKLSQAPALTLKGNVTNSTANVTDITLSTVKTLLDITNQTLVYNSYPQTVNLNNKLHTAIFCEVGITQGDVVIPDGQFNGQIVFFSYNQLKVSEDNRLVGKFIVWSDGNTDTQVNTITNAGYVVNGQAIYWSTDKGAWMVPRIGT